MRKSLVAFLLIAWLHDHAVASPGTEDPRHHDRVAPVGPDDPANPWIDQAPSKTLALRTTSNEPRKHKLAAALTLGGLYAGFVTWTYFAWYRKGCRAEPRECHEFVWGRDGAFGVNTYAGGADKLGHAWATLALGRLGTEMLHQWGGYSRLRSALIGAGLSETLFAAVEFRDGFTYQFSYWDFTFNTLGAALGFAQSMWPRVDELVDLRVQYFPSSAYRPRLADGDVDVAEDYSGQTYLLAFHLGAIRPLREARWGAWSRYVDLAIGFETRGYKPDPRYKIDPMDPAKQDFPHRQTLFIGATLNMQGALDHLIGRRAPKLRKVLHGVFEVFNLPYTTLPAVKSTRHPTGPTDMDGA